MEATRCPECNNSLLSYQGDDSFICMGCGKFFVVEFDDEEG